MGDVVVVGLLSTWQLQGVSLQGWPNMNVNLSDTEQYSAYLQTKGPLGEGCGVAVTDDGPDGAPALSSIEVIWS